MKDARTSRKLSCAQPRFTRRTALFTAIGAAAAATGLAILGTSSRPDWSFLETDAQGTPTNWQDVISAQYVPLGPEIEVNEERLRTIVQQHCDASWITQGVKDQGFDMKDHYVLTPCKQTFGVPLTTSESNALEWYCQRGFEYLYEVISGLEPAKIRWTHLWYGQEFTRDYHTRGFIGRTHHSIYMARVQNTSKPEQQFVLPVLNEHSGGSFFHVRLSPDGKIKEHWFAFMGTGPSALLAPFSELQSITLSAKRYAYAKHVGYDTATVAEEALTEAISYVLAHELVNKLEIPRGAQHIESIHHCMYGDIAGNKKPQYRAVPAALIWVREHGVQAAFDLYMDDPRKFMNAIGF